MQGKLIRFKGYNYKSKDGYQHIGRVATIQTSEPVGKDDSQGNYDFGLVSEEMPFRNDKKSSSDMIELIGTEVEFVLKRDIGEKYEKLVDILPLK